MLIFHILLLKKGNPYSWKNSGEITKLVIREKVVMRIKRLFMMSSDSFNWQNSTSYEKLNGMYRISLNNVQGHKPN